MSDVSRVTANLPTPVVPSGAEATKAAVAGTSAEFATLASSEFARATFPNSGPIVDTRFPFSPAQLQLADPRLAIKANLNPILLQAPASGDVGLASGIDQLMAEAKATLSDPNATLEQQIAAQEKMQRALLMFEMASFFIKQESDLKRAVLGNLKN
jgi:hypothetical protein